MPQSSSPRYHGVCSIPAVFHDGAIVCRRATVSGAHVGAAAVVEPSGHQAGGNQIWRKVGRRPNHEVRFWDKLLSVEAVKSELGNKAPIKIRMMIF
jgi:hypothetical protein